jgi:hypothetical protein
MARLLLHDLFLEIVPHVYFQPPSGEKMVYPCIEYHRDGRQTIFAGNSPYAHHIRYQVTVIDEDPDSELPLKVAELPMTRHERFFVEDNLNHDVFTLYFKEKS